MPRLEYALTGIKCVEAHSGRQPHPRLPITMVIMQKLRQAWVPSPHQPDHIMLWAAACTGFFGFLRHSHTESSVVRLHIKQSKTDPFRQGVDVFLGQTSSITCPMQALIDYISVHMPSPGPLFMFISGDSLACVVTAFN